MEIKVLGGRGCKRCEQTERNVRDAVAKVGVDATVEKITDVMEIANYGICATPAVVIDGEIKSVGKIPSKDEIKIWLEEKKG